MPEPPRTQSALQPRPNRFLHSLSQFKGIVRLPGRKTKDDRDLQHYPYPSQTVSIRPHAVTKPYMSQPHLGLKRGLNRDSHDAEVSKLSGSSERSLSHDECAQQKRSSLIQEQPLGSTTQFGRNIKTPSPPPLLQSKQQPQSAGTIVIGGSIDGLPMTTMAAVPVSSSRRSTSPIVPRAQPADKRTIKSPPTASSVHGPKRPSTANSVQSIPTTTKSTKTSPLLTLKRSFSQLRLYSSTTLSDAPDPSPLPSSLNRTTPISTNSTSPPPPPGPAPRPPTSITPTGSTNVLLPSALPLHSHPQHLPAIPMSGALAPMSVPRPLPSGVQRRPPTTTAMIQPLTLPPINHRISLTMTTDTGSARLSPTVISRPPPLPLLNLPTLTLRTNNDASGIGVATAITANKTQRSTTTATINSFGAGSDAGNGKAMKKEGKAQLKSMPALPLQGTGRGVGGHEEADDVEDDDDEEEEDDDDDEDEDSASRLDSSSRSGFLAPDTSGGATVMMRPSWESSASSLGRAGLGASSSLAQSRPSRDRTPSSSSSYHSALNVFSPESTEVVLLKHPTPPRGHLQNHTHTPTTPSPHPSPYAQRQKSRLHDLPEVDTSRLDLSFLSRSPPASPADTKGKGKARDFGHFIARGDHRHDLSPTPTTSTTAFRGFIPQTLPSPSPSQTQSPTTGTLGQQQHQHGGGDYFSSRGTAPASSTLPHSSTHPYLHSRTHTPFSHPLSPTSQIQTPRTGPGSGGDHFIMRSPLLSGLPTPKRSSTVLLSPKVNGAAAGGNSGSGGGGGGGGGSVYGMPMMVKRASQSLVDLHTIETKERRRLMDEEARVEEEKELGRMREREKEKERGFKARSRFEDEKVKEDDEERDKVGTPTKGPSSPLMVTSPTGPGIVDGATKKQNRLSTASLYLRRRRSMPMYDESSEPPPYPTFAPRHIKYKVMPREDEGREKLPPYTNAIYLKAIMPRKLEFSHPGVQARDRKWRRVMCVLEGTAFRVYKCPPGHAGVGLIGEWWEKQVGAGDVSLQPNHAGAVPTIQIETRESRRLAEEQREIERQIQRIMKADGGDGVGEEGVDEAGETMLSVPANIVVPPTVVVEPGPLQHQQYDPTSTISSSKSRFTQLLKPGRSHVRSKSDHMHERATPNPSPRPSLNIPRGSGASTPISGRSHSPFGASMRAHSPVSSSSHSIMASGMSMQTSHSSLRTGSATPTSPYSIVSTGQQQQQAHNMTDAASTSQLQFTSREKDFLPDPDPADLIREYTMQHAESGLGNDYGKRKNVIRVRLEGEQFLLQARDVAGVIEWIEGLQASMNIALDLDERPMPRGPMFPRRRRRRRAQQAPAPPGY